jgi:transposase-like protein
MKNVAPNSKTEQIENEVQELVRGALPDKTAAMVVQLLIDWFHRREREFYLREHPDDVANGHYRRKKLNFGSVPLELNVPRTRSGQFKPSLLPGPYQRGYSEETRQLLLSVLASSRSLSAAKSSIRRLGIGVPEDEVEAVAADLIEDFHVINTGPLPTDCLALYLDGKEVDVQENGRVQKSVTYVVIGVLMSGISRVLACHTAPGPENLDEWKKVMRSLIERGLRRVLILVQDDFSGLEKVNSAFFPKADIQLCMVHMQRNARKYLTKSENAEFQDRIREIKNCRSLADAIVRWEELCQVFSGKAPHFIERLRKRRDRYLAFLDYPAGVRQSFSTTNKVEAFNNQLERLSRNSGSWFQSRESLEMKLGILITTLHESRWKNPSATMQGAIHDLVYLFGKRYEEDSDA